MPTVFHGTGLNDGVAMVGPPSNILVGLGGGEFGRGFYTQYSARKALGWALRVAPRLNGPPAVVRLDIDPAAYAGLIIFTLDASRALNLTDLLDFWQAKRAFTTGCCDVIEGPVTGDSQRIQQKFESDQAQTLLNSAQTLRTVI